MTKLCCLRTYKVALGACKLRSSIQEGLLCYWKLSDIHNVSFWTSRSGIPESLRVGILTQPAHFRSASLATRQCTAPKTGWLPPWGFASSVSIAYCVLFPKQSWTRHESQKLDSLTVTVSNVTVWSIKLRLYPLSLTITIPVSYLRVPEWGRFVYIQLTLIFRTFSSISQAYFVRDMRTLLSVPLHSTWGFWEPAAYAY